MNEQLQAKLVEILAGIQSATKVAGDFAIEQLPDIAQQYVVYGRALATAYAIFAVLLFCVGWFTVAAVKRKARAADAEFEKSLAEYKAKSAERNYHAEPYRAMLFEVSDITPLQYVPFAFGAMFFMGNLSRLLLVWFAPKVWLLQEIAGLIK